MSLEPSAKSSPGRNFEIFADVVLASRAGGRDGWDSFNQKCDAAAITDYAYTMREKWFTDWREKMTRDGYDRLYDFCVVYEAQKQARALMVTEIAKQRKELEAKLVELDNKDQSLEKEEQQAVRTLRATIDTVVTLG